LPNENQVLLRVPRENNMYNVNLKNIVPSGDLTYLFAKATIDESNLWHRRLRRVNFKNINKLVKGNLVRGLPTKVFENQNNCVACMKGKQHRASCKFEGKVDEGFLVGYSVNSKAFRVFNSQTRIVQETLHAHFLENKANITGTGPTWLFDIDSLTRTMNYQPVTAGNQSNPSAEEDATFDGNEHSAEHPELTVKLSPSSNALSGEQDGINKKRDKGKSLVNYFTGNKDFNEDYSEDSSVDVSAAGPIVPTAGQNYSNSTNLISAAGPLNSNTSPIHRNSLFQDASQSHDMLENKDIVYFDHENVGAEADFNNLETSITVSP
nr:ribonuclease H-like domain-containing protein [Tanacetum cinerariifolium]